MRAVESGNPVGGRSPEKMLEHLLEIPLALLRSVSANACALVFSVCVPSLGPHREYHVRASGAKYPFMGDFLRREDGCVEDGALGVANRSHSAVCVKIDFIVAMYINVYMGTVAAASTDGPIAAKTLGASLGLESWASKEGGRVHATT